MSKLILKRFQCVVETDEIGADSPYFVTFVGDITTGDIDVKMTRQGNWHNEVDQGETWIVNETVAQNFDFKPAKTLVLCAMVEEDEGVDINHSEVQNLIKTGMKTRLKQYRDTGSNVITPLITNGMASTLRGLVHMALITGSGAADDFVAVKPLKLNGNTGDQSVVPLIGDGGRYNVRYTVA